MHEGKERKNKQSCKLYIIGVFAFLQLCLFIIEYKIKRNMLDCAILINLHSIFQCKDDWIQDIFFLVWTTAVAVAIFIVESSKEYKYGITLKKIIRMTIGVPKILAGAIIYLLLCMLFFVFRLLGYSFVMVEITGLAMGGLIFALCFWIQKSTGKEKENTDHPYMQSFLDILAECREKELDLLIELMTDDIMGPFIESEDTWQEHIWDKVRKVFKFE